MEFKISKEFIQEIEGLIAEKNEREILRRLEDIHFADIAELMNELNGGDAGYLFKIIESEISSEILLELDEEVREKILNNLSAKEIAEELDEMDTDDAVDIIAELPEEIKDEVISELEDFEHAKDIVELLRYDEDTAGGLMAKEYIQVNENWNVLTCIQEIRKQAENVSRVHSIYVVDDEERLKGRLSLKDLITSSTTTQVKEIYIPKVDSVKVDTEDTEVARIMQKYDLEAIPVIDETGRLVGRITIDDIVDVIKEEADRDYQMAAGISQDVEADDSIWELTKARLPWLLLALLGSFIAVNISESFSGAMEKYQTLFFFTPLVAAMAGNVGVQSSAIVVQGLANNSLSGSLWKRLGKEMLLALLNSTILAVLLLLATHFIMGTTYEISTTIVLALVTVMILASLIGTFIPITLNKYGIDPAIATGPFITTSNDIFGILIYFTIAKLILGF
ncbi:magnesium transporter [Flavobacterium sp. xlx-214]|uniref:magnesium transporter n=1 Tax=unclassified Flavobacterium TaxID=196869 RepID=UPI0013D4C64F|nr:MULTISPECIES: magnesium transporter [unclassified Flavobacterium]MBA5793315.1 magnesium transporter [Flavobacterium sp. xlx-221]QMI84121.1 magnesium transporter [Flavobacterium sp. xlx-214]